MSGRSRGRGRGDFFSATPEERRPLRRPGDGAPAAGGDDRPQPRRPGDGQFRLVSVLTATDMSPSGDAAPCGELCEIIFYMYVASKFIRLCYFLSGA